tara:strand:- start:788 stop:1150 length:363 start_codon:yes stop_codon:yes gene_type:complete
MISEDRLQSEVVKYIKYVYPKVKFCASLGGIFTTPAGARKAIRNGYSKGFPDLFVYESRTMNGKQYHGLAIEIKTMRGRPTKEQKEWIEELNKRNYKASICKGLPAILSLLDDYLHEDKR